MRTTVGNLVDEVLWLRDNPAFTEKPATIDEFLGPGYLNIADKVRPGLKVALREIFGEEVNPKRIARVERAMMTGAIGIGKTTFASIALPYMAHWVLCLRDPQAYYNLLPGSRIAFMQMSTSEDQARDVVFGDIKARIQHSKWFTDNAPYDPKFTKQFRFPKEIWILPGDSAETTFEGYNILGGILDEADSHKVTKDKDFAEQGYNTIHSRIDSRFVMQDEDGNQGHQGLLIVIGQMKKATGFANKTYKEFKKDPKAFVMSMTIWESYGWERYLNKDGTRNSFWYDTRRKQIVPSELIQDVKNDYLIEIPVAYKRSFLNNPVKALRDLAGIPPEAEDPFISLVDRVDDARAAWIQNYGDESPVTDSVNKPLFKDWFVANNDPRRRAIHVDLAYSPEGDALGMAMGHVREIVEIDEEFKPVIVFDMLLRMKAPAGGEILLQSVREIIYQLKERHFRIDMVTYDGFESTDTLQQLRKKRYRAERLSVDRSTLPYEDLRDALYEHRLEFPPYITYLTNDSTELTEIAVKELLGLQEVKGKVDHPANGSKDVADAMAGVACILMGDRNFKKGVPVLRQKRDRELKVVGADFASQFSMDSDAPGMPAAPSSGDLSVSIPPRLLPRR